MAIERPFIIYIFIFIYNAKKYKTKKYANKFLNVCCRGCTACVLILGLDVTMSHAASARARQNEFPDLHCDKPWSYYTRHEPDVHRNGTHWQITLEYLILARAARQYGKTKLYSICWKRFLALLTYYWQCNSHQLVGESIINRFIKWIINC